MCKTKLNKMTKCPRDGAAIQTPLQEQLDRQIAGLEQRYQIGSDRYCGMTPAKISRAVIACPSGPRRPGEPVGYWPARSEETRTEWLPAE